MYMISIKEVRKILVIILLTFPFLSFDFVLNSPMLRTIQISLMSIMMIWVFYKSIKQRILFDRFIVLILIFQLSVIPFSLTERNIVGLDIIRYYGRTLAVVALCCLFMMFIKKDARVFAKAMALLFGVLVTVNFFSIVLAPGGLTPVTVNGVIDRYWVLGYDNGHGVYQLLAIMFAMLAAYSSRGRYITKGVFFLFAISLFSAFYLWTSTTLAALVLVIVACWINTNKKVNRFVNARVYTIAIVVMITVLLGVTINGKVGELINLITTAILKKDVTFTNRTNIWRMFFSHVKSLVWGNGYESDTILRNKFWINSAHNQWFQMFYNGGLIHIFCYLLMVREYVKRISKNAERIPHRIVSVCVFGMMLIQLMRTCFDDCWISMLVVGYMCDYFVPSKERSFHVYKLQNSGKAPNTVPYNASKR